MQISGDFDSPRPNTVRINPKFILIGLAAIVVLIFLYRTFAVVPAGHRGVLTTFGSVNETVLEEGFHVINPLANVNDVSVQTQLFDDAANASSKDLQSVSTNVSVNYSADPAMAWWLFQRIGQDYSVWETKILRPAVQESVKAVTAAFTAEDLIKKRPEVKKQITEMIETRVKSSNIKLEQVSITNFAFSKAFDDAIEAKVRAEQEAQKAENDLQRIKAEQKQKIEIAEADKERTVLEAEAQAEQMTRIADAKAKEIEVIAQAEAQAHKIIAEAVTPESLRHRTIERWDGILPKVVGGSSGLLLQLGLEEEPKSDKR